MVAAWQLCVAEPVPVPPRFWDPELLIPGLVLVGAILIGALIVHCVNQWRTRPAPPTLTANEQLAGFRELYEQGQLSQGEFERIKARLAPLVRAELNIPQPKGGEAASASAATSAPDEQQNNANNAKIPEGGQTPTTPA